MTAWIALPPPVLMSPSKPGNRGVTTYTRNLFPSLRDTFTGQSARQRFHPEPTRTGPEERFCFSHGLFLFRRSAAIKSSQIWCDIVLMMGWRVENNVVSRDQAPARNEHGTAAESEHLRWFYIPVKSQLSQQPHRLESTFPVCNGSFAENTQGLM